MLLEKNGGNFDEFVEMISNLDFRFFCDNCGYSEEFIGKPFSRWIAEQAGASTNG